MLKHSQDEKRFREEIAFSAAETLSVAETETARPTETATQTLTPIPSSTLTATITMTPTATLKPGATMVSEVDGMVMVYVPAGTFIIGMTDEDVDIVLAQCYEYHVVCFRKEYEDSTPQHDVYLDAFWIDQTEVTNNQFRQCVLEGKCLTPTRECSGGNPTYRDSGKGNYPAVCMDWYYVQAYCEWAGRRLPTEAEWEKATRGVDGRIYPRGDQSSRCHLANYEGCVGAADKAGLRPDGASPYGVLDMFGNVNEWVSDWYNPDYYQYSPAENPLGPDASESYYAHGREVRVVRGSYWKENPYLLRIASRHFSPPSTMSYSRGFRCAMDAES
jgi:eukaryotic-like serine/threonine-protein kinase